MNNKKREYRIICMDDNEGIFSVSRVYTESELKEKFDKFKRNIELNDRFSILDYMDHFLKYKDDETEIISIIEAIDTKNLNGKQINIANQKNNLRIGGTKMIAREKVLKKLESIGKSNPSMMHGDTRKAWCFQYDSDTTLYCNLSEILVSHENLSETYGLGIPDAEVSKVFRKGLVNMKEEEGYRVIVPKRIVEEACKYKRKAKSTLGFRKETYGITFYNSVCSMPKLDFNPVMLKNMMDWVGIKPSGNAIVEVPSKYGYIAKVFNEKDPTYEAYGLGLCGKEEHYGDRIKHDTNFYAVFVEFNPDKAGTVKCALPAGCLTVKNI
jgi:hypothetical protein